MSAPWQAGGLDELRAALRDDVEAVAVALLGPPNRGSARHGMRWGSKGSLSLALRGSKRGAWFSHEAGEGGGPFGLIRHALGCGFPDAVDWARRHTGIQMEARVFTDTPADRARRDRLEADRRMRLALQAARGAEEDTRADAGAIAWARSLAAASLPAGGTPADAYLALHRCIPRPSGDWPAAIRWDAAHHALIAISTTADGAVRRTQRVHLAADGAKLGEAERARRGLEAVKLTSGRGAGDVVRLPGDPNGPLLIAEGIETGLSAWVATGYETWIVLGSVRGATLPAGRRIVILSDDDPRPHDARRGQAARGLARTLRALRRAGLDVAVATPWPARRWDGSDLNDVMRVGGAAAVAARVGLALSAGRSTALRMPMSVARARSREAAESFRRRAAAAGEAFAEAVLSSTGVGKSTSIREGAVALIRGLRTDGDARTGIILVPRHDLGRPYHEMLRQMAPELAFETWRGLAAEDPDSTVPGATMCGDLDLVREAQAALLDTERFACKPCALRATCAYQRQKARRADVWIGTHDLMAQPLPSRFGTPAAVWVDESPLDAFLVGADERKQIHLSLDALLQPAEVPGDLSATLTLGGWHRLAVEALRAEPDGQVSRAAMLAAGLTHEDALACARLVWRSKAEPAFREGMGREERREAMRALAANRHLGRRAMWWTALAELLADGGPEASGWAALVAVDGAAGPQRVLRLRRRKPVGKGWDAVPVQVADATGDMALLAQVLPGLRLSARIEAAAPWQRVRQADGRAYSAAMLDVAGAKTPEEARRRARNVRDLWALIAREARRYRPGRVLVVAQKAIRAALEALGPPPPGVSFAHHGAVTGRDDWKEARLIIVVGRTQPPPAAVEALAEALTGRAVAPLDGWYPRVDAVREMADGSLVACSGDRHPDPVAERFRWQACEAGLVQVIGRGRGGDRGPEDPLDVLVLTDVPIPLPIGGLVGADELDVDTRDLMLAAGGVALRSPRHMAAAYPSLWTSWGAAKKAVARDREREREEGQRGTDPYMGLIGDCPPLLRIGYQLAGQRQHRVEAGVDPAVVPDPRAWLETALGPLAAYRVGGWGAAAAEAAEAADMAATEQAMEPVAAAPTRPVVAAAPTAARAEPDEEANGLDAAFPPGPWVPIPWTARAWSGWPDMRASGMDLRAAPHDDGPGDGPEEGPPGGRGGGGGVAGGGHVDDDGLDAWTEGWPQAVPTRSGASVAASPGAG